MTRPVDTGPTLLLTERMVARTLFLETSEFPNNDRTRSPFPLVGRQEDRKIIAEVHSLPRNQVIGRGWWGGTVDHQNPGHDSEVGDPSSPGSGLSTPFPRCTGFPLSTSVPSTTATSARTGGGRATVWGGTRGRLCVEIESTRVGRPTEPHPVPGWTPVRSGTPSRPSRHTSS